MWWWKMVMTDEHHLTSRRCDDSWWLVVKHVMVMWWCCPDSVVVMHWTVFSLLSSPSVIPFLPSSLHHHHHHRWYGLAASWLVLNKTMNMIYIQRGLRPITFRSLVPFLGFALPYYLGKGIRILRVFICKGEKKFNSCFRNCIQYSLFFMKKPNTYLVTFAKYSKKKKMH